MMPEDLKARITSFEGSIVESCEKLGEVMDPEAASYLKYSSETFIHAVDTWAEQVADLPIIQDAGLVAAVSDSLDQANQYLHDRADIQVRGAPYLSADQMDDVLSNTVDIINAPLVARLPGSKLDWEPPSRGPGKQLDYEPPNKPKTQ
jgi:hypothetical protein